MDGIELYKGDCLQVMQELIDKGVRIDAIICDPPYGTTACKWDSVIPFDKMWERLKELRKERSAIVLFGAEPFSSMLRCSNIKEYKHDWVWKKTRPSNFPLAKKHPMKYHEIISVFSEKAHNYYPMMIKSEKVRKKGANKGADIFNGGDSLKKAHYNGKEYTDYYPSSIVEFANPNNNSFHPTQKPVALLEYLIKTYTNEGDTVLDFTMGSGSTGVACVNTNRNFIGIELDDKYFEIAESRIKEAVSSKQSTLF